ncbi:ABC transporter permease subunit, partial [Amaricoccus sp.]|uniref:ABC transporter permease n=1 Tax=Amaricoccus sp. TaxID=1872485 RepID=UPI001B53DBA5
MNRARCATIAGHEARAQLRSPAFWVLVGVLLFVTSTLNPVAMIPTGETEVGGERAFVNSAHALAQSFAIASFFAYTFFAALMAGFAVIRDDEARIGDLLHSTPLTAAEYALGKFAGVAAALGVALAAHLLLALAFHEGPALAGVSSGAHGPFRAVSYLGAVLLFALPGIAWTAAVAFVVGLRTRRPMAVYAVPTVLFVYTILISWNLAPAGLAAGWDRLLMIVDPTAIRWLDRALFRVDRGVGYFNAQPIAFDATFLFNRLLTLSIAGLALVAAMRERRRSGQERKPVEGAVSRRAGAGPAVPANPDPENASFRPLGDLAMTSRAPGLMVGVGTIVRSEAGELLRQPALYLFSAFLMLVVAEVAGTEAGLLGSPVLLTAGGLAVRALPVATVLVCLYLLFAVVEAMHRDRATGFEALLHAAPVSDTALMLGKGLAIAAVIAVLCAACVAAGLVLLLAQGGERIEIGPLVLVFGLVLAPTYLLWAAFVSAVMVIVRSRTAAIAIGLATLAATAALFVTGAMTWVTNWPLWGALRWTDMGIFPLNGAALVWNRAAALGGTLFFFVLACTLLVRTERDAAATLDRLQPARVVRGVLRLVPFLLLPLLIQGFLAIEIRQGFEGSVEVQRAAEYWRSNVATWKDFVPPEITRIDLRLDLEPSERRMSVAGSYALVNDTQEPMR